MKTLQGNQEQLKEDLKLMGNMDQVYIDGLKLLTHRYSSIDVEDYVADFAEQFVNAFEQNLK